MRRNAGGFQISIANFAKGSRVLDTGNSGLGTGKLDAVAFGSEDRGRGWNAGEENQSGRPLSH